MSNLTPLKDSNVKSGIYAIRNKVNGKIYIGSSVDVSKRQKQHYRLLTQNKHHSYKLQADWNKYGEEAFEWCVIEEILDLELLEQIEQKYLDDYKVCSNGYNVALLAGRVSRQLYPEKKVYMNNAVTPTAQVGLDAIAASFGLSRSELLERIGRGLLLVMPATGEKEESDAL